MVSASPVRVEAGKVRLYRIFVGGPKTQLQAPTPRCGWQQIYAVECCRVAEQVRYEKMVGMKINEEQNLVRPFPNFNAAIFISIARRRRYHRARTQDLIRAREA